MTSYWQTLLDWSSLGGFFTSKDIAQRYGIFVKPIDKLSLSLYLCPGLVIPLKYEIAHESVTAGESFLFIGEMAIGDNVPVFMMSHTAGFSARYGLAAISFELYSAKPTYFFIYR